ncbi:MAG: hypothetical protein ACXW2E_03125 [Nitrososphaeraceae archaeon]
MTIFYLVWNGVLIFVETDKDKFISYLKEEIGMDDEFIEEKFGDDFITVEEQYMDEKEWEWNVEMGDDYVNIGFGSREIGQKN